jgi:circadian locomoter output cycle kaput protein
MISSQINSKIINSSDDSNNNNLTVYDLIHEEERNFMEKLLEEKGSDPSFGSFTSVLLHFKDHDINSESDKYQLVRLLGSFYDINNLTANRTFSQSEQKCFVAIGRLQTPKLLRELSFQSSTNDNEFVSRNSLEWKFLYLDHRAPPIIGYLPFEILGTSGYDYYHWDDLDDIVSGHEQLMRTGEGTSCTYRFLTKSQQWIWLRTSYYIAYHQWNFKPEFIVCTHTVVKVNEVSKAKIEKMNLKIDNKVDENRCSALSKDNFSNSGFSSDSSSVEPRSSSTSLSWWSSNRGSYSINSSIDCPNMSRASTPKSASQLMSTTTTSLSNNSSNSASQKSNTYDSNSSKGHSQLHEFLQQKHELLQHQIKQQQEELRRVTEQLVLVEAVNNE